MPFESIRFSVQGLNKISVILSGDSFLMCGIISLSSTDHQIIWPKAAQDEEMAEKPRFWQKESDQETESDVNFIL